MFLQQKKNCGKHIDHRVVVVGGAHAIVTSYKYTDTLQVCSTQNTSPDTQIQVQTLKIQVQTPQIQVQKSKIQVQTSKYKFGQTKYQF